MRGTKTTRSRRDVPLSAAAIAALDASRLGSTRSTVLGHPGRPLRPVPLPLRALGAGARGVRRAHGGSTIFVDVRLERARGRDDGVRARPDHGHEGPHDRDALRRAARHRPTSRSSIALRAAPLCDLGRDVQAYASIARRPRAVCHQRSSRRPISSAGQIPAPVGSPSGIAMTEGERGDDAPTGSTSERSATSRVPAVSRYSHDHRPRSGCQRQRDENSRKYGRSSAPSRSLLPRSHLTRAPSPRVPREEPTTVSGMEPGMTGRGESRKRGPGSTPHRGVAQLAERWSPKPEVAGSIPVAPARHRAKISRGRRLARAPTSAPNEKMGTHEGAPFRSVPFRGELA